MPLKGTTFDLCLLQHPFVTQLLTRNLVIELLDTVNNPELHPAMHSMEDNELEVRLAFPLLSFPFLSYPVTSSTGYEPH